MGVQQRPSINAQCLRLAKFSQAIPEILPVSSIPEDLTPFNSPAYHVMQGSRRIQSRLSCHDPKLYLPKSIVNNNLHLNQRPLFPIPAIYAVIRSYLRKNSCSGRHPAFAMSSFHFAGSFISLIALPGPPASICALFLAGSPHTMNSTCLIAGVGAIFSQPGILGYHGGSIPFLVFLFFRDFWSSASQE